MLELSCSVIVHSIFFLQYSLADPMFQVQENLLSALLFYAVAYVCMSFQFRAGQKRSFNGLVAVLVIGVFSVKLVSIQ